MAMPPRAPARIELNQVNGRIRLNSKEQRQAKKEDYGKRDYVQQPCPPHIGRECPSPNQPHLCFETRISPDFHLVQRKGLPAPMIFVRSAEAFKSFIMSDKNRTHLLRDGGLPGIIFPHATRGAPLNYGSPICVHTMNSLPRVAP